MREEMRHKVPRTARLCQKIYGGETALALVLFMLVFKLVYGCYTCSCNNYGTDCQDYQDRGHTTSGVYHVTPPCSRNGYDVYCDMTTDGGGWLVFQRRLDGSLDFYKNWREYESGFGDPSHEHWLGLLPLKRILSKCDYELRIDLTDFEGNSAYAKYEAFDIGDFTENYRLKITGYTGNAVSFDCWPINRAVMNLDIRSKSLFAKEHFACYVAHVNVRDCNWASLPFQTFPALTGSHNIKESLQYII